ncbi:MAG TPA: hypothetical protein VMX35_07060 [Acidobacteriota bacterium]|nr:hypothetical protein [Acidobacteriota bacterium]
MNGPRSSPPQIYEEYRRVRNLGAILDVVLPLVAAIVIVLFNGLDLTQEDSAVGGSFQWLKYGLVAFSVTICIVARILLGRLMSDVRKQAKLGRYKRGWITHSYFTLFALYLVPAVWGIAYFIIAGDAIAFLILDVLTVLAFLFLTPSVDFFWQ